MHIATSIKQKACEGLLHFRSHYSIAKELGISKGSVRDWCQKAFKNSTDKALDVSTGGI